MSDGLVCDEMDIDCYLLSTLFYYLLRYNYDKSLRMRMVTDPAVVLLLLNNPETSDSP